MRCRTISGNLTSLRGGHGSGLDQSRLVHREEGRCDCRQCAVWLHSVTEASTKAQHVRFRINERRIGDDITTATLIAQTPCCGGPFKQLSARISEPRPYFLCPLSHCHSTALAAAAAVGDICLDINLIPRPRTHGWTHSKRTMVRCTGHGFLRHCFIGVSSSLLAIALVNVVSDRSFLVIAGRSLSRSPLEVWAG